MINLIDFALLHEWKKQILMQGFEFSLNSLNNLVELLKRIKTAKEILYSKGDGLHPNKNPISMVQSTTQPLHLKLKG